MIIRKTILYTTALLLSCNSFALINSSPATDDGNTKPAYLTTETQGYTPTVLIDNSIANNENIIIESTFEIPPNLTSDTLWIYGLGNPNNNKSITVSLNILAPAIPGDPETISYNYAMTNDQGFETIYSSGSMAITSNREIDFAITVNKKTGEYTFRSNYEAVVITDQDSTNGVLEDGTELFAYMEGANGLTNTGSEVFGKYKVDSQYFNFDWAAEPGDFFTVCGNNITTIDACQINMDADYSSFAPAGVYQQFPLSEPNLDYGYVLNGSDERYLQIDRNVENFVAGSSTVEVKCQANLITPNTAITTASCVDNGNLPEDYSFLIGDFDKTSGNNQNIGINSITIHPLYTSSPKENDIAILNLNSSYTIEKPYDILSAIEIDTINNTIGENQFEIYGWGDTDRSGTETNILQNINLGKEEQTNCSGIYPNINASQTCLRDYTTNEQSTSEHDEGAPAIIDNMIHSMFSFLNNPSTIEPVIFSNVFDQIDFLENNISDIHNLSLDVVNTNYNSDTGILNIEANINNESNINDTNNVGINISTEQDNLNISDSSGQLICSNNGSGNYSCNSSILISSSLNLSGITLEIENLNTDNFADIQLEAFADGEDYYELNNILSLNTTLLTNVLLNISKNTESSFFDSEKQESTTNINFNLENLSQIDSENTKIEILLPMGITLKSTNLPNCDTSGFPIVCSVGLLTAETIENYNIELVSKDPTGEIRIRTYSNNDVEILETNNREIKYNTETSFNTNNNLNSPKSGVDSKSGGSLGLLFLIGIPTLLIKRKKAS